MQVKVTSRHGTVRQDAHDHIVSKAEKLLTYFERVTQITVTVDFQHEAARVEVLVDAEHRHDFVAADEHAEVTAAFDSALHKVEQQIRKYKEKVQNHRGETSMSGE